MRLSSDITDPGYAKYEAIDRNVHNIEVYVDGDHVVRCITADEEEGTALVFCDDGTGGLVDDGTGNAKTETLVGKVDIVLVSIETT